MPDDIVVAMLEDGFVKVFEESRHGADLFAEVKVGKHFDPTRALALTFAMRKLVVDEEAVEVHATNGHARPLPPAQERDLTNQYRLPRSCSSNDLLVVIEAAQPVSRRELSELTGLDQNTMSQRLGALRAAKKAHVNEEGDWVVGPKPGTVAPGARVKRGRGYAATLTTVEFSAWVRANPGHTRKEIRAMTGLDVKGLSNRLNGCSTAATAHKTVRGTVYTSDNGQRVWPVEEEPTDWRTEDRVAQIARGERHAGGA